MLEYKNALTAVNWSVAYKNSSRIKTTEKQALPSVQPETETLVETVLSASAMASRSPGPSSVRYALTPAEIELPRGALLCE